MYYQELCPPWTIHFVAVYIRVFRALMFQINLIHNTRKFLLVMFPVITSKLENVAGLQSKINSSKYLLLPSQFGKSLVRFIWHESTTVNSEK